MRTSYTSTIVAILVVIALVGGLAYAGFRTYKRLTATPPPPPACEVSAAGQTYDLDTDQAAIASAIAGVAARRHLPRQALTIAYATALQESDLENLDYGDRDSVGVFQQRPSQGWGTIAQIENPLYATTRFFEALVEVPKYTRLPIAVAAQDVQHSADGSAYGQYDYVAAQFAVAFTTRGGVWCWYTPTATQHAEVTATEQGMRATFGPLTGTTGRSAKMSFNVRGDEAWTVAGWLVTHAQEYEISYVRYAGYEWTAGNGSMGWQPQTGQHSPGPASNSIVAG
ncbi:MAG TPA: hypothetical protein VN969_17170 [Streptosporangiaceae bacterium]|nr:hypothetical protein [Streptosporangiaceae bacterium]